MNRKVNVLPDFLITIPILLLLSLGILVIYSSDPKLAIQQAIVAIIGFGFYWLLSLLDFEFEDWIYQYLYLGTLILLVIVFIFGTEIRGVLRWIALGPFWFQPSEFVKPVLILFLARFWTTHKVDWRQILKSLGLILPFLVLIFKQPDLGTVSTLVAIWLIILIGANISFSKLTIMGLITLFLVPISWIFLKNYQKIRILSFFSPAHDPLGTGYNVIQSTIAVGSGGIFGRGLGRGTQSRLQFLPEFRTDFIFASIAEEFGFLGSVIVLVLYGVIIGRAFQILSQNSKRFRNLVICGVLGMLFFQIMVNIGMNIGLLPVTGITLPLLSYGGSSILSTLICLGFLASIARSQSQKIDTLRQAE